MVERTSSDGSSITFGRPSCPGLGRGATAFAAQAQSFAAVQPRRHHCRFAVVDGFSLHAEPRGREPDDAYVCGEPVGPGGAVG